MLQEEVQVIEGRRIFVFKSTQQFLLNDSQLVGTIFEGFTQIFDLLAIRKVFVNGFHEVETRDFDGRADFEAVIWSS